MAKRKKRMTRRVARLVVYVQFRVWHRESGKTIHVPRSTIVVEGLTPGQVHKVFTDALATAYEKARKAAVDGKKETFDATPGVIGDTAASLARTDE